jgi:hypothetical protein
MRLQKLLIAVITGSLAVWMSQASAATWYVSPTGNDANDGTSWDNAKQTIQAGVDAAEPNGMVFVDDGIYLLTNQITVSKGITVFGAGTIANTIIDCQNQCRGFYLGEGCVLDGVLVTNGFVDNADGGGVYCVSTNSVLRDCVIKNSRARHGDGVYGGTLEYGCNIINNLATNNGGGVYNSIVSDGYIAFNSAVNGGAAYGSILDYSEVNYNSASQNGGGVYNCTVSFSDLAGNKAISGEGGGAYESAMNNCIVMLNQAINGAGARGDTLNNCLVLGNEGTNSGGAYSSTLNNCTIVRNKAETGFAGATASILNNCIAFNETSASAGNLDGNCTVAYTCAPDAPAGSGNITVQDPTQIFVSYDINDSDYHLAAGSPCINAGHNAFAPTNITPLDVGGSWRICGDTVDMGAYEYGSVLSPPKGVRASRDIYANGGYLNGVRIDWLFHFDIDGHEIWRHTSNNSSESVKIVTLDKHWYAYFDTNVVPGTVYYYWVKAFNASSTSDFSSVASGWSHVEGVLLPNFNPDGGVHPGNVVNVTVTCGTDGATIRYTTNGNDPTEASPSVANGGIVAVPLPGTLKAKAWKAGMQPSAVKSADYTTANAVATPEFAPNGGAHPGNVVNVTITCATPGATIRYTTNGNDPTEASPSVANGGAVAVPLPGTLKAKAWKAGMTPSAIKSATYDVSLGPGVPTNVSATDGKHLDKVTVTWSGVAGATSYRVYRHINNVAAAAQMIGTSTTTRYDDKTAKTDKTYYYWVKAVNASGASGFSALDTGYLGVVGPLVMINNMVGDNIRVRQTKPITVTATMANLPAAYLGVPVDWWVAAYVQNGGLWFYFDANFNLVQFDGNLANVRPAYQGALFNVPPQTLVRNLRLTPGVYKVWFAVDYPMDGALNLTPGYYLMNCATLTVE